MSRDEMWLYCNQPDWSIEKWLLYFGSKGMQLRKKTSPLFLTNAKLIGIYGTLQLQPVRRMSELFNTLDVTGIYMSHDQRRLGVFGYFWSRSVKPISDSSRSSLLIMTLQSRFSLVGINCDFIYKYECVY